MTRRAPHRPASNGVTKMANLEIKSTLALVDVTKGRGRSRGVFRGARALGNARRNTACRSRSRDTLNPFGETMTVRLGSFP